MARKNRVTVPDGIYHITSRVCNQAMLFKSEARRAVEQGGVSVDDEKVTDVKSCYTPEQLSGDGIVVRRGKKSYKRVKMA